MNNRTFLPLFFVALGLFVAGAIVWRVRAYTQDNVRATINAPGELDPASPDRTPQRRNGGSDAQQGIATDGGAEVVANRTAVTNAPNGSAPQQQQPRAGMTLREQRFAEALAAAQRASAEQPQKIAVKRPEPAPALTPPAPPKPPEKQGVLSRIGDAISNAFKGNSSASAAPQTPQQQNPNPSQRHDNPHEKDAPATKKEKDPTSDTQPPQLLGVTFQPPSISDGAETMLIVTAQDDLSGIRNISGSVASPTGKALQGFAAQRESPDSNRFVARIVVPKDAEQGFWKVNFLSLTDNAGNTTNVNSSTGYGFAVNSARPDNTPPVLTAVWVDRRSMNAGEKNTIFVRATDDKSGVAIVSGVFQSPAKSARIGFGCRMAAPDQFECDLAAPNPVDCGDWQLEQIQMQDKAQNMATFRGDNPLVAAVKVNMLSDKCDSTPPAVESITLDPTDVSNAADSVVTATAIVTDDTAVQSVSMQVAGPPADNGQPPRFFFGFQKGDQPNVWIGKILIPKSAAKGTWSVVWLSAIDKSNNVKNYSQADAVLQNAKINVH